MKELIRRHKRTLALLGACTASLTLIAMVGCSTFGSNPSPPTAVERAIFDTVTNYVPQTNIVTRIVPVLVTNEVTVTHTNEVPGQPPKVVTLTNHVTVIDHFDTNSTAVVTNVPQTTLTPGATTKSTIAAGAAVANNFFPGIGTMVGAGLSVLLGAWGYLRSSKANTATATAGALAQEVETVREFIKALPNGLQYDTELTSWLQSHQTQSGVVANVLGLLSTAVNNADAKVAAQQLINVINDLNSPANPAAPKATIGPVSLSS